MLLILQAPEKTIDGTITLEGSKSISNRLLIMKQLCASEFTIQNLSPSDDTNTLQRLLNSTETTLDVGAAGTTMRFLTAFFAIQNGERVLTGSERMKKRPLRILVDALRTLGADIKYLEQEGFPPIKINGKKLDGGKVKIRADVSSQYISALLMIGPVLQKGIILELDGKIGSFPYILMTLKLMEKAGIGYEINNNNITIFPGAYQAISIIAESDWSAASYYFSMCALSPGSRIIIRGLTENSLQGDSVLPEIYDSLGVSCLFKENYFELKNTGLFADELIYDFSNCPDLAQTVVVTCAALGVRGRFSGLESLKIKETDRTNALGVELIKFGVRFFQEEGVWILQGKTAMETVQTIQTYEDHRMAMCFAALAITHGKIIIEEPEVVNKSYPSFWSDLKSIGFSESLF